MILVDSHIHIHDNFTLNTFFNSALSNFKKYGSNVSNELQGILCLTESYGVNVFNSLEEKGKKNQMVGDWSVKLTENINSLWLENIENYKLLIISGRQIVTSEKLEVLAIGLNEEYKDGQPIDKVLEYVKESKVIPIIPWGAGKWLSSRKKIVEKIILQLHDTPIFLGDNGNRPWFWRLPNLFNLAEKNMIVNLPGSDPLPFDSEMIKPGSFGFKLEYSIDDNKPFDSFYNNIMYGNKKFETFGRLETLTMFFKNQIQMQVVKRSRNK